MSSQILAISDIRTRNERLVLRAIKRAGVLSQSEAANQIGLHAPTVFRIFSRLSSQELIEPAETNTPNSKPGRRPVYYRLRPDTLYAVGVEFSPDTVSLAVVDFAGRTIHSSEARPEPSGDATAVTRLVAAAIRRSLEAVEIDRSRYIGIGVAAPGMVNTRSGSIRFYSQIPGMIEWPLGEMLSEALDLPVIVHNNSAVLALSEHKQDDDSTLAILIRAGVGAGMVHDGTIFSRGELSVLEFGHMSVYADGRPCSCGGRGCIEEYLSEDAILEDVQAAQARKRTRIQSLVDVDEALGNGHPKVAKVIAAKGMILSAGVRNLIHLLGPQSIVLITRYPAIGNALRDAVAAALANDQYILDHHDVSIRSTAYEAARAARSAAGTVFDVYLGV